MEVLRIWTGISGREKCAEKGDARIAIWSMKHEA